MKKSATKEKAQAPTGIEAQAKKRVDNNIKVNSGSEICLAPKTPNDGPMLTRLETDKGYREISVYFFDPKGSLVRLGIDSQDKCNATNRLAAALNFYKWDGEKHIQVPLLEGRDDLMSITLGNFIEVNFF